MKVLVTGITGMIGSHFANACREKGWDVVGIARSSSASRLADNDSEEIIRCDIIDKGNLTRIFEKHQFDYVAHFAAQAFNSVSWEQEWYTHYVNNFGTLNVLSCIQQSCPKAKVLLACSSAEYGLTTVNDGPLTEDRPLRPVSPYGVSKVVTENLGYQYAQNYGLNIYLPRLFIHVGTGHPPATAIQNFARQLARISKGKQPPVMSVGSLDTARDFVDVRDGVAGLMMLLESEMAGIPVNISTGEAHSIRDVLKMLIEIAGVNVEIEQSKTLFRPSDEPVLLGDNSRLKSLGWKPKYSFRETLSAVYEDWLARV